MSKSSLEAAAEAAAKVNAMLIAKGKLKLPQTQIKPKIGLLPGERTIDDLVTAEVEINDAPLDARNLLTKGHTQDEICKYSGAALSTRGRYMTFDDKVKNIASERPLYLHVQASSRGAVDLAVSRIIEMIAQYDKNAALKLPIKNNVVSSLSLIDTPQSSGLHFIQEKVFVGLEAPASFSTREKIIGPNASYLQHIKTETGANVTLRGRGSGFIEPTSGREAFEPLYIHLTHPKPEGLQAAKALALNLVDTVHSEFSLWQQQQQLVSVNLAPAQLAFQSTMMTPMMQNELLNNNAHVSLTVGHPHSGEDILASSSSAVSPGYAPVFVSSHLPLNIASSAMFKQSPLMNTIMQQQQQQQQGNYQMSPFNASSVNVERFNNPIMNGAQMMLNSENSVHQQLLHQSINNQPVMSPQVLGRFNPQELIPHSLPQAFNHVGVPNASPFNQFLQPHHSVQRPNMVPANLSPMVQPPPLLNSGIITSYPHLSYLKSSNMAQEICSSNKRKFTEEPDLITRDRHQMDLINSNSLQDQQHTLQMMPPSSPVGQEFMHSQFHTGKDRDLMPPPVIMRMGPKDIGERNQRIHSRHESDHEIKRLRGALGGLAMYYGSDDSDDEVTVPSPVPSPKHYI